MIYTWLTLGAFLISVELLTRRGFSFCVAMVSLLTAYVSYLFIVPWPWQLVLFVGMSVITIMGWRRYLRYQAPSYQQEGFIVNSRQYIGQRLVLTAPLIDGASEIELDDQIWLLHGRQDLPAGTEVEVFNVDGTILKVMVV